MNTRLDNTESIDAKLKLHMLDIASNATKSKLRMKFRKKKHLNGLKAKKKNEC